MELPPNPAPYLPIPIDEDIRGYWRNSSGTRCSSVLFRGKQRWLFHSVQTDELAELLDDVPIRFRLMQQLEQAVPLLQDKEVDGNFRQIQSSEPAVAADQQPVLPWLANVRLVPVTATGPGHRAFNPGAAKQILAVAPTRDFKAGELIGFYLGRLTGRSAGTQALMLSLSACCRGQSADQTSTILCRWTKLPRFTTCICCNKHVEAAQQLCHKIVALGNSDCCPLSVHVAVVCRLCV
jgi:hypothetical protein